MTEPAQDSKPSPSLKPLEPSLSIYKANLDYLGPEIIKLFKEHKEKPVGIDADIKVSNLNNPQYLVILGLSTLKVLKAALDYRDSLGKPKKTTYILIIEPDIGRFHALCRREYVRDILGQKNVDIVLGEQAESLGPHLYKVFTNVDKAGSRLQYAQFPEIVVDPFAFKEDPTEPERLTQAVFNASKQAFLALGCASDSHFRWEQFFRNQPQFKNYNDISTLKDKFKGMPAVVVGAGPSMDTFIENYDKLDLYKRSLIIACDAALPKLLKAGCKPHIVTRCERKLTGILGDVTKEATKDVYYAAYPWCSPEFFERFDNSFMLFRSNGLCKWSGYPFSNVDGGVSSANAAFELAYLLGVDRIVLTGVDLCFVDGKSHTEGTTVEFDINKSKKKWMEIEGNSGMVTTIPVWHRCFMEYQSSMLKHGFAKPVINTAINGVKIPKTTVKPWEELGEIFSSDVYPVAKLKKASKKVDKKFHAEYEVKKVALRGVLEEFTADFEKLVWDVDPVMLTATREEEKCVGQLKQVAGTDQFWTNVKTVRKSLSGVFKDASKKVDEFKNKWYKNPDFMWSILDICQVDYFRAENECAAIPNKVDLPHHQIRNYVATQMNLFRIMEYYAKKMLPALKGEAVEHEYFSAEDRQNTIADHERDIAAYKEAVEQDYRVTKEDYIQSNPSLFSG